MLPSLRDNSNSEHRSDLPFLLIDCNMIIAIFEIHGKIIRVKRNVRCTEYEQQYNKMYN